MEELITIRDMCKIYNPGENEVRALDHVNLAIHKNEFVAIIGQSGSGKSTLMNMLGCLDVPTSGTYLLNGKDVSHMTDDELSDIRNREIGFVFQGFNLIAGLTALENVELPLIYRGVPRKERMELSERALEKVGLAGRMTHKPSEMSGGQQQRVAIARAIVNEPEILLLDEPLGALDYKMRKEMQFELKEMHKELGITFIFVTHDQEEALALSDKVVVMADGKIQQAGKPEDIYKVPENAFVADFIGESNIFDAKMVGDCRLSIHGVEFGCKENFPLGDHVEAVIRPESVILCSAGDGKIQGKVHSSVFKGTFHEIVIYSGKSEIVAQNEEAIEAGTKVGIDIKPQGIHVMPYNQNINHYEGLMDASGHVLFVDGSRKPDLTKLFSGKVPENTEGIHVMASFLPADANLSDDPAEGFVEGNIISIIYKGDHYKYKIRSKNDVDYYVDDEWLWNMGDYVSVVVPDEKITYEVINKGARDD